MFVEQREHLAVHDPLSGREPLHVASTEPRGRTERVGVIDVSLANERDCLEPAMRMLRESGHRAAVVHPPTVGPGEVHADVTGFE
ncbi:MAG: hypothetical protein QOG30_2990 [Acidimicrobiaceae bacterium]